MSQRAPRIQSSLAEYSRGILGGLIFSMPLLLTMEVWWAGFIAAPERLLAGVGGTLCLLIAYNAVGGIRHAHGPVDVLIESIEELGLGLVLSLVVLTVLGRIDAAMPMAEVVGKMVVAALPVAIGVSVGTAQLGGGEDTGAAGGDLVGDDHGTFSIAVLSLCGATLLSANVAPTEEVVVLGAQLPPHLLLVVVGMSLVLAAVTLFYSEFHGSRDLMTARAPKVVLHGCIVAYSMALLTSAAILWFFDRFAGASAAIMVGQTVVLALPGTLGAAAGRLLLK